MAWIIVALVIATLVCVLGVVGRRARDEQYANEIVAREIVNEYRRQYPDAHVVIEMRGGLPSSVTVVEDGLAVVEVINR